VPRLDRNLLHAAYAILRRMAGPGFSSRPSTPALRTAKGPTAIPCHRLSGPGSASHRARCRKYLTPRPDPKGQPEMACFPASFPFRRAGRRLGRRANPTTHLGPDLHALNVKPYILSYPLESLTGATSTHKPFSGPPSVPPPQVHAPCSTAMSNTVACQARPQKLGMQLHQGGPTLLYPYLPPPGSLAKIARHLGSEKRTIKGRLRRWCRAVGFIHLPVLRALDLMNSPYRVFFPLPSLLRQLSDRGTAATVLFESAAQLAVVFTGPD